MAARRTRIPEASYASTVALPRSRDGRLALALIASLLSVIILLVAFPSRPIRSRWNGTQAARAFVAQSLPATSGSSSVGVQALSGPAVDTSAVAGIVGEATPITDALESYNQGSVLQGADARQHVRFFRRDLPGGGVLDYFVVNLDPDVRIEVVGADGARPTSDASGDTLWADGQQHLASVAEIAAAPYAVRDGMELLAAMAFGFHGDVRTSDEGTVVVDGRILRVNAGRSAICITRDGQARIGLFDEAKLRECDQAAGAGPVILWGGKIANPDVAGPDDQFVPFNPLGEDFVQIDWRRTIYAGPYPKTVVGVGSRANGRSFIVMALSYGVDGIELARQLKAMGCTNALGGDDDTSTQAVWRGAPVRPGPAQEVPDALTIYVRR